MTLRVPSFGSASVLVVGDLMLDRYWQGATSRISPEAPVPVVKVSDLEARAGGAGNVAINIAMLGAKVAVNGLVGRDEAGKIMLSLLEAAGVQCGFELTPDVQTITKLRVLSRHQQLLRMDFEESLAPYAGPSLLEGVRRGLEDSDVMVLSDYAKGTLVQIQAMIQLARDSGIPVLIDPKGSEMDRYRGATLLTPNLSEFEAVVGHCANDGELVEKGVALRDRLELEALLITRSERGMTLLQKGHEPLHLSTRAREVFDVTGAGDTVISVLAAALAAGQPLAEATALSNLAAGVVVGKLGTATVSVDELQVAIQADESVETTIATGMLNEEGLARTVQRARDLGERIVMTNGCFDILHAGHVSYLEQAKKLGDRLIVAVNDDDSVRRLKGKSRPINGVDDRMTVLAALRSVDWVVPFSEDTPERLICRLLPDVLVKGGDYKVEEIAGHQCVQNKGGEVVIIDFKDGCSTTKIITSIIESR